MKTTANFSLPMSEAGRKLMRSLKQNLEFESEAKERRRWIVLDTFDWRLLSAGFVLLRDRQTCELHRAEGDEVIAVATLPVRVKPTMADTLPAGTLRDKVKEVMGIRAVMARAEFIREVERFRVVNRDGKTTVRLEMESLSRPVAGHKPMPFQRVLRVVALKGYESEADEAAQQIESLGLEGRADTRHYVFAALEASGVTPFNYSSKIQLDLSPEQTAREACAQILVSSREQMRANVEGMLADIDSEFLHDYRVALRRTRSVLQLVQGVYPEGEVLHFKQTLGDVMRGTNRLRDLDVYLLEQEAYAALLPPALRPGLEHFFADLRKERGVVVRQFVKDFQGATVKNKLIEWEQFLKQRASRPTGDCPDGEVPAPVLASRLLEKRFNRIIKDGRKITDDTPDEAVHQLRIQFKKLRYLLEFFRSLYDTEPLDYLIKRSRKIQSVLGDFNDVCVQQRTITDYLKTVNLKRPEAVQLCAALGALVAELERKRHGVRHKYRQAFSALDDPKVLAIAGQLFRNQSADPEPEALSNPPIQPKPHKKATSRRRSNKQSTS